MKYKVGDKVRIIKDLKAQDYDGFIYDAYMKKYKNNIATIIDVVENYYYRLDIDNGYNSWTDGMLEPVKEERTKFKVGDKVKLNPNIKEFYWGRGSVSNDEIGIIKDIDADDNELNIDFPSQKRWTGYSNEVISVKEDIIKYKGKKYDEVEQNSYMIVTFRGPLEDYDKLLFLKEHKEEILDEKEKEYLRNVIKYVIEPTHNEVDKIIKCHIGMGYYIEFRCKNGEDIPLPLFKDKRMYAGMKDNEPYTLEKLGL